MSVLQFLYFAAATCVGGFGFFVYQKNKSSKVNSSLSQLALALTIWLGGSSISFFSKSPFQALFWYKLGYTGIVFIPVTIYNFLAYFLNRRDRKVSLAATTLACAFTALLWGSKYFVNGVHSYRWGFYPKAGVLHPLFLLFFFVVFSSFYILLPKTYFDQRRDALVIESKRTIYVFWALVVGNSASLDFIPNYGYGVLPVGFIFMVAMVSIFGYAILAYQLMDIEVVIKRTLVFAGLSLGVLGTVALMTFVTQDVLVRYIAIPRLLSNFIAAGLIAAFYTPLRNWLINVTERYLFQKKYDYKELLKKFTDEVMVVVDLTQLVQMTVNTLTETVKLESCTLLLLNKDKRTYELAATKGLNGKPVVLEEREPFITFLRETQEPIGQDGQLGKVRFPEAVTKRVKELGVRLCLPLHLHDDLIGVLCLGKKKSDEEFTQDDLDILLPLARTLAIAVSNAQLFVELARTQAEAAQKEKLAVIGTLSAGINHEICNPLGIVKAQCEAFLLDMEDGILIGKSSQDVMDRTSNIMRVALKQIDRATAITQKLSNFAKPIKETTVQEVSVAAEIDEVLLLVGHDLTLEKVEVVKEIQPGLPPINADRRQLQEVLFNIIRNAGQAIVPPGKIWVRAHTGDEAQVRIEIEDTGSGIPPDKLEKIYDPFFTTKEPGKGTGLGLFIVRQIVERNKGRILVQSTVGKGTTFFLDFPAAQGAPVAAHS